jgi:probable F420-dependent oxidoreductase
MQIGVFYFPTDYGIQPAELARALEDRGYESVFFCEHTHIPTSRRSPYPGGGELPRCYAHTHDPFVALSFAAAATQRLRVGTAVCLVTEHDPIVLAKTVASLDTLSGGRFVFGIGAGWNAEEMENHGTPFEARYKVMGERVRAMKALWTEAEAQFHGVYENFDPVWSYPKPVQRPHPPILLGGETDHTLKRVAAYCDGWLPRAFGGFDPVTRRSLRSRCSARRMMLRNWPATARPASNVACWRFRICPGTKSFACSTGMRRWSRKSTRPSGRFGAARRAVAICVFLVMYLRDPGRPEPARVD